MMYRDYNEVKITVATSALTYILSKTKYAKLTNPVGWYTTVVSLLIGINSTYMNNQEVKIHENYLNLDSQDGVISEGFWTIMSYDVKYYDAETGKELGTVSYFKPPRR